LIFLLLVLRLTAFSASPVQERADRFLKLTNAGYQALFRVNSEAQWLAVTDVTPGHDAAVEATGKAYAAFNGNPAIITETRDLLTHEKELTPLSVRQLKQLLLNAAEGPMTNPDLVVKRVEAETKQASILNRNRRQTGKEYGPGRAQGNLGSLQGIRARAQTESRGPARSPERCGEGNEISRLFLVRSRQLRNDDG